MINIYSDRNRQDLNNICNHIRNKDIEAAKKLFEKGLNKDQFIVQDNVFYNNSYNEQCQILYKFFQLTSDKNFKNIIITVGILAGMGDQKFNSCEDLIKYLKEEMLEYGDCIMNTGNENKEEENIPDKLSEEGVVKKPHNSVVVKQNDLQKYMLPLSNEFSFLSAKLDEQFYSEKNIDSIEPLPLQIGGYYCSPGFNNKSTCPDTQFLGLCGNNNNNFSLLELK